MKWIKAHKVISLLICVIIALLIVIGTSFAGFGSSNPVSRVFQSAVALISKPISAVTGEIRNGFRGIFEFREIVKENDELKNRLAELKEKNAKLSLEKEEYDEMKDLEKIFGFKGISKRNTVGANVVSVDSSNWMGVFTVDKGTENGIKDGCAVINSNGLVGKVIDSGKGYAKVSSVLDETNKISFKVYRDKKLVGIAQGDGHDGMEGYMLDSSAGIIEGDLLVTSGVGLYPKGIEIGKVTYVEFNKDTQYKEITVKPAASLKSLQKVAVII